MPSLRAATAAAALAVLSGAAGLTHAEPSATADNPWKAMAKGDLAFAEAYVRDQYISIVYPAPGPVLARLAAAKAVAEADAEKVDSFGGYNAVLQRFVHAMDDEHVGIRPYLVQSNLRWPGFLLAYQGRRYITAAAAAPGAPANGSEVTSCDGRPMNQWVDELAMFEGGHRGLESTKARVANLLLVDKANPFFDLPKHCVIGNMDTPLAWQDLPLAKELSALGDLAVHEHRETSIAPFGRNSAWVRLGIFQTETDAETQQFRDVITRAPSLRSRDVIVLDVRGNGGGPYNWFMAFLRSLYGDAYADYYARARVVIEPVYRATPETRAYLMSDDAPGAGPAIPPDPQTESGPSAPPFGEALATAIAHHEPIYKSPHVTPPKPTATPQRLTNAKVYVLTDYGCGSACIAFADEMRLFPGVTQIGLETFVDNRTGTPLAHPLPSGNGRISVPILTRDKRERGDAEPVRPLYEFEGNIADDAAVRDWIIHTVLPRDGVKSF